MTNIGSYVLLVLLHGGYTTPLTFVPFASATACEQARAWVKSSAKGSNADAQCFETSSDPKKGQAF